MDSTTLKALASLLPNKKAPASAPHSTRPVQKVPDNFEFSPGGECTVSRSLKRPRESEAICGTKTSKKRLRRLWGSYSKYQGQNTLTPVSIIPAWTGARSIPKRFAIQEDMTENLASQTFNVYFLHEVHHCNIVRSLWKLSCLYWSLCEQIKYLSLSIGLKVKIAHVFKRRIGICDERLNECLHAQK